MCQKRFRARKSENLVFLHWRRQREDLSYLANGFEVDLVVGESPCAAFINVTHSLGAPEVFNRETAGLTRALQTHPGTPAVVVAEETGSRPLPSGITVVPAWKYLLDAKVDRSEQK